MSNIVTGVICGHCKEPIWSRHRHDFRYCFCGSTAIDGGSEYTRVCFEEVPEYVLIDTEIGEVIDEYPQAF